MSDCFHGKNLMLVEHTSVIGIVDRSRGIPPAAQQRPIREIRVSERVQHGNSVVLSYTEPKKRVSRSVRVSPDNITYYTVEENGRTLYDTRDDVPCDMEQWQQTRARFEEQWAKHFAEDELLR